jgi:YfiH family protein
VNLKKKNNDIVLEEVWCENGAGSTLPLLKYPLLEQTGIVEHCFTTRIGGVSKGIYESLNLSFTRGDEDAAVRENFRRLAGAMETDVSKFVFTDQTHTTNVRRVTAEDAGKGIVKERDYTDIDGLITNEPGLVLSTFYADCVPLYFVDPVHRAIGMSHSGWKGTVGKMGAATITAMKREFGTEAKDLVCAIGPSICQDCYEVSEDVADAFKEAFPGHADEILLDKKNGKYQLDLWRTNEIVLTEAGVLKENITNICTCCNPDLLFSHRASHGKRGNLGAFIYLRNA